VYVVNNGDHSMSVVDTLTNTAVTTVAVGVGPSAVALSPDGATAFVTNTFDGSVCLIDLASATVTKTVLVGEHPLNVAVSHDGRLAYVSELDESCHHGSVSIIDIRTGVVMAVPGGSPCGLACDPHGYRVFVTDFAAGTVSLIASVGDDYWPQLGHVVGWHPAREVTDLRIDRAAGDVITVAAIGATFVTDREHDSVSIIASPARNVAVGASPTAVAIRPDSTRAYVTNPGDGTVSVIDTVPGSVTHLEVIDTVEVGHLAARGILISSDGRRGYAADDVTGGIWVIDTDLDSPLCHQVVSRIMLQHSIFDLALGSSHLFAVPYGDHLIAVDVTTEAVAEIALPGRPYRVTVCPDASRVYAHLFDDDAICAIDVGSFTTTATLNLGEHGQEIAFSPDGKLAYVARPAAHSVYVISTKTSRFTAVDVGRGPRDVAVSSDGARAYVANLLDDSVSVIESHRGKVVSTIDVGTRPCRVALSPDCCHAYVANHCDNTLSVLDTEWPAVSTTIAVGRQPFDITVSPDGKRIYVDHADGISVVSL
jgi:YVTN family beta-propeller protein